MRRSFWIILTLFLASGCSALSVPPPTPSAAPATNLPTPAPGVDLPDPQVAAFSYLEAWKQQDYFAMYTWLSPLSQDAVTDENFITYHQNIASTLSLLSVDYEILSTFVEGSNAQVRYRVRLDTILVGEISRSTLMNLSLHEGQWRVQWQRTMILPELADGNALYMEDHTPARGNIYDRFGSALVAQADAVSLGIINGQVDPFQEDALLNQIWVLTGVRPETVRSKMQAARDGWYIPIAEVAVATVKDQADYLNSFEGFVMEPFRARYYFNGGVSSQVLGYVSSIQPEEVQTYLDLGYRQDDRIGRMGLEQWGERFLAGTHGGALYVVSPEGQIVTKLAESTATPAQSIYTTLHLDLQMRAQQALKGFLGAIIVMERDTGRVLVMASSPGFDPNLFEPSNLNSDYLLSDLLSDTDTPFLNRATQGQYPLGSVFKTITMAAALESGEYNQFSSLYCGHFFTEIPGITPHDWTYTYGVNPSGGLTLPEGLMRSCNPWFWHIGNDFWLQGDDHLIAEMANAFGLGQPTGLEQIIEEAGSIPTPINQIDAINLAIGQGGTLVTPIQVVRFMAAIGNGGFLLRPQVIDKVVDPGGRPVFEFEADVMGTLPLSPENLKIMQNALVSVVANRRGTANFIFRDLDILLAGKTGTAEAPPGLPHAWFAGYTYANNPEYPDLAIVVVLEHAGEGSTMAAPIFKYLVESYFYGAPVAPLPWQPDEPAPAVEQGPAP